MQIIKTLTHPERTAHARSVLTTPGTIVLADIGNRENPASGNYNKIYQSLHNELREMGVQLAGTCCPYGDYTIARADTARIIVQNNAENAARTDSGITTRVPLQKLDIVQPHSVAVDTKTSSAELYNNLKYQTSSIQKKLRRAANAGVQLYWLVIDDVIVDGDPADWCYTGRNSSWHAWEDLCKLMASVELSHPHLHIYFCRRADAADILMRMLVADYTLVPPPSPMDQLIFDSAYHNAATQIRIQDNAREVARLRSEFERLLSTLSELLGMSLDKRTDNTETQNSSK